MESTLKNVKRIILEKYDIKNHYDESMDICQYRIVDKITGEEKAQIQLSVLDEIDVAEYTTKDHWFKPSETKTVSAINLRWITSNQKGLGTLLLAYGVLEMSKQCPNIQYSVLDDVSEKSTHIKENIYTRFGYSPTEAVVKTGDNTVKLRGPEKQVLLKDFVKRARAMFPSRGRSTSRGASNRSSRRRKSRNRKS